MKKFNVLITGASRGIGFAIADVISEKCNKIFITSKNEENISIAYKKIRHKCEVVYNTSDFAYPELASEKIYQMIEDSNTLLDAIVLDAGIFIEGKLAEMSDSLFYENLNVNLITNHKIIQKLLPLLKRNCGAKIIVIGSTAAYEAYPIVPSYGLVKWALRGYCVNLRKELSEFGIGVSFISPGGTLTDMWADEALPENRLLDPYDIAKVVSVIFELSNQAVVEEIILRPMLGDIHE